MLTLPTEKSPYTLALGDCLDLLKELPDGCADAVITDPPYGLTCCEWDSRVDLKPFWDEIHRVCRSWATVCMFCIQPFTTDLINSNRKEFRHMWYWKKNNVTGALASATQPMRCIEEIAVFGLRGKPGSDASPNFTYAKNGRLLMRYTYRPQGIKRAEKPKKNSAHKLQSVCRVAQQTVSYWTNYPTHLLEIPNESATVSNLGRLHPTQKPVALLEYLIRTHTDPGALVIDPFMGSGTTGVACLKSDRRFIGFELVENYYQIAEERIRAQS